MQEYLIPSLLTSIIVRLLICGASIGEAIAIISISSLYGLHIWLKSGKEAPINESFKIEIDQLKQDIKLTRDNISSLKLGTNLKK